MSAYYNENDPKAAAWLRELMWEDLIPVGHVDERSIEDVKPSELVGYRQCHFFAGIGGWAYALRLAGWPDDREVWTGSCPCQPFSAAGKGKGFADERHLWPAWFHLIQECRPERIFGEQVANCLPWLDLIQADLEAENYASGAVIMGAHSVGTPHIRQRLYFVADRTYDGRGKECADLGGLAQRDSPQGRSTGLESGSMLGERAITEGEQHDRRRDSGDGRRELADRGDLGHADQERQQQHAELYGQAISGTVTPPRWADAGRSSYVDCRDGKRRPVEPGTFPLAHGVPHRVGLLRGYGNAIVPQVAAAFIQAYCEVA